MRSQSKFCANQLVNFYLDDFGDLAAAYNARRDDSQKVLPELSQEVSRIGNLTWVLVWVTVLAVAVVVVVMKFET